MVVKSIMTSATQKAMSQLYCLARVLKGSPAIKAPTAAKTTELKVKTATSVDTLAYRLLLVPH